MARRHLDCSHFLALVADVSTSHYWNFMPASPINVTVGTKNRVKTCLVKWHVGSSVLKQLPKLMTLISQHLFGRPILAFHQRVEDFLVHFAHHAIPKLIEEAFQQSRTGRLCVILPGQAQLSNDSNS